MSIRGSPAWSPDGTEIVYVWNGQIWSISPVGGEPRQYTFSTVLRPNDVDWSPDGTRILYTGFKDQSINLWVQQVK
jgi:Tol biopolymer transport system component